MPSTLTYTFEELPLVLENGLQAALIDGEAEISYSRDVWDFTIQSISLNSYDMKSRKWKPVALDEGNPLYGIIYDRLESFASENVQEAIRDQLAEDRAEAAEMRAESRRDDLRMGIA